MDNEQQPVMVEFNVPARMRDGTVLRANVYRPAGEGPWPVLLTRLPYSKDLYFGSLVLNPVQAARRGWIVVVQETRGCGASGGEFALWRNEAEDGADTVAWAAALPHADGQVGMYGQSYFGYTQWAASLQQPPALKALVPMDAAVDSCNGLQYRGGALKLGSQANWYLSMGIAQLRRRFRQDPAALGPALSAWASEMDALGSTGNASLPLAEFAPLRRQACAPGFLEDYVQRYMDRAAESVAVVTMTGKHDRVLVPTLLVGGWYDEFLGSTLGGFQAMRAQSKPAKLLIGPWTHQSRGVPIGERNFGYGSQAGLIDLRIDLESLQLRWFDHWLKGRDTGMLAEPPVKIFVMGANCWRDEQEWPLARAVDTPWYVHADGMLSPTQPEIDELPDGYDYDPANPVPTRGGPLLMTPEYPSGPYDQRAIEARTDVVVYRSLPLHRDMEVTGPIVVRLWAISSAPDTDFVARLVDVSPDGHSYNLTDGIVRARYRRFSLGDEPALIVPGKPYEYLIDLWATSNVFRAGHRVGLQITSSCFPRWDRNLNTGHPIGADAEMVVAHQHILHDREHPSHVVLPLIP